MPFLFFAAVAWFLLQYRPRRRAVWNARWAAVEPFAVVFALDIIATLHYFRSFKLRQIVSVRFWRERLQFKKIWQDFQKF